jgi:thiol-disulfide isomerase/thioredoxin
MTQRSKWRVWMALALILVATVACRRSPQNTPTASATVEPIEEFTEEALAQYQGKVVVLNFWATWCVPCRTEMPDMEATYRKYRDQGLVILAVNADESSEAIAVFVNELGLTFPILRDSQRKARDAYDIRFLPTTLFLNRDGRVFAREVGLLDQKALLAQIGPLLD